MKAVNPPAKGRVVTGTVTYVQDGDGAQIGKLNCRIEGIDAPETDKRQHGKKGPQPYSTESLQTLQKMILNKQVTVTVTEEASKKNHDRPVCKIEIEGADVSTKMLEQGAAMIYEQFYKGPAHRAAQDKAKAGQLGIWNPKAVQQPPQPPWNYRHTP